MIQLQKRAPLTPERLKELLRFDPETGHFYWRKGGRNRRLGVPAGTNCNGYIQISLDGKEYGAHRLVWLWITGHWPELEIDHIDRCKSNNRPDNLRDTTHSKNRLNSKLRADNTSGYNGVYFNKSQRKWRARIQIDGIMRYLGSFASSEEAHAAYTEALECERSKPTN
jgi:hypothetical protein